MKNWHMFLLAFIVVSFASFSALAAGNAAINISSDEGKIGDEVQISVKLTSEMRLCFASLKITYDTNALELVSAGINDSLSGGGGVNTNTKWAWANLGGHTFNNDTILNITFKILDAAQAGTGYELNAEFDPEEDFIDNQDNSVLPAVVRGSVKVLNDPDRDAGVKSSSEAASSESAASVQKESEAMTAPAAAASSGFSDKAAEKSEESENAAQTQKTGQNSSPKNGSNPRDPGAAPETGDDSSLLIWAALLMLAGGAFLIVIRKLNREKMR